MAQKRMFDKDVISLDNFLDLPMEAKALYFLLGMEADDEGFVSPKKVVRLYGGTEDSIKILILKGFIIPFKSGIVVITDWERNNWLDKRRTKATIYTDEKAQISFNNLTKKYECLADVKQMLRENRIEQNSIEENRKEEKRRKFVKPTLEEIEEYCSERNNGINANAFYDFYESKDWYVGKNKMKDWKACVRTWEQRDSKFKVDDDVPEWFDKDLDVESLTEEEKAYMDSIMEEFK